VRDIAPGHFVGFLATWDKYMAICASSQEIHDATRCLQILFALLRLILVTEFGLEVHFLEKIRDGERASEEICPMEDLKKRSVHHRLSAVDDLIRYFMDKVRRS
jgi:hypothetical protein